MTFDDVLKERQRTREELLSYVRSLDEQHLTTQPQGHWSVLETLHHLYLTDELYSAVLQRLVDRAPEATAATASSMLEQSTAAQTELPIDPTAVAIPEDYSGIPAVPGSEPSSEIALPELLGILESARRKIDTVLSRAAGRDLSEARFRHPVRGKLNFYEWLVLITRHEALHTALMRRHRAP